MDFHVQNKENIIAKVQKFIDDGCGCRQGSKGIQSIYSENRFV